MSEISRTGVLQILEKGDRDLSDMDLSGLDLNGMIFNYANLQDANLEGTNLKGANLKEANITKADFTNANLDGVKGMATVIGLETANMTGTHFDVTIPDDTDEEAEYLYGF
jgi:uncharacterized protein YjbI with pentapeptide repeats